MESYIVRLYRRDVDNPEYLVGLVETVGESEPQPFHTVSELVAILSEPPSSDKRIAKPMLKLIEAGKKNPR